MTYSTDSNRITHDGIPIVTLCRATWGDGAPTAAELADCEAFTLRAVNSHAALVEALQTLSNILADDLTDCTPEDAPEDFAALSKAAAALELARC